MAEHILNVPVISKGGIRSNLTLAWARPRGISPKVLADCHNAVLNRQRESGLAITPELAASRMEFDQRSVCVALLDEQVVGEINVVRKNLAGTGEIPRTDQALTSNGTFENTVPSGANTIFCQWVAVLPEARGFRTEWGEQSRSIGQMLALSVGLDALREGGVDQIFAYSRPSRLMEFLISRYGEVRYQPIPGIGQNLASIFLGKHNQALVARPEGLFSLNGEGSLLQISAYWGLRQGEMRYEPVYEFHETNGARFRWDLVLPYAQIFDFSSLGYRTLLEYSLEAIEKLAVEQGWIESPHRTIRINNELSATPAWAQKEAGRLILEGECVLAAEYLIALREAQIENAELNRMRETCGQGLFEKANTYKKEKNLDEAKRHLLIADKVFPNNPEIVNALCYVLRLLGEFDAAEIKTRQLLQLLPAQNGPVVELARLEWSKGNIREAIKLYWLVLDRSPHNRRAFYDLAKLFLFMGRREGATRLMERMEFYFGREAKYKYRAGMLCLINDRRDLALKLLEEAGDQELAFQRFFDLAKTPEDELIRPEKPIGLTPEDDLDAIFYLQKLFRSANLRLVAKQFYMAIELFEEARRLNPINLYTLDRLLVLYSRAGYTKEAEEVLGRLKDLGGIN
jgi:Flp pilus assembly protein TadD